MREKQKSGSAIPLVLIFAFIMFVMALAYSKQTQTSNNQTIQIDERLKMDYAMESVSELALLKYQLYPADYYISRELARPPHNNRTFLNIFLEKSDNGESYNPSPFLLTEDHSVSNFNDKQVQVMVENIEVITTNKWNTEALMVTSRANYTDSYGRQIDKTNTRLFETERYTDTSVLETPTAP